MLSSVALDAVDESREDIFWCCEAAVSEEKDICEVFSEDLRTLVSC